jgi:hypothetical protein
MTIQFWLGFAAYLVPLFPLAFVWHLKVFKPAYDRLEMFRESVIVPFGLLSMVMQAVFFSWAFPLLFTSPDWLWNGLQYAVIFGLLGWSFMVLPIAAKYRMASVKGFMLLESCFLAIQFVVTGLLLALVYAS